VETVGNKSSASCLFPSMPPTLQLEHEWDNLAQNEYLSSLGKGSLMEAMLRLSVEEINSIEAMPARESTQSQMGPPGK